MKPVLYDHEGRAIRFRADDGKVYAPVDAEQFAKWDGSPLRIVPSPEDAKKIVWPENVFLRPDGRPDSHPEPPEVIAVKESLDPVQRGRAEVMRRLGGGPLAKAQRAANARALHERLKVDEDIKVYIDGLRTRPIL